MNLSTSPKIYLEKRAGDDWIVGDRTYDFTRIADKLYLELTQTSHAENPPKILLAERNPVRFMASFIAAVAAGYPVFLCNPDWVKAEWQQVFDLVQPNLILGQEAREAEKQKSKEEYTCNFSQFSNCIMIPTGGSSGKIRFAIHTWETLTASVQGFQQYFQLDRINSFCTLPLYHVSGLMQFVRSFTTNGKLVISPFKAVEKGDLFNIDPNIFFISLVPTQLQRLLQNPELTTWLSQFHIVLLGGAPAWSELLKEARNKGVKLALTYGMTETASQIATLKPEAFLNGFNNCGKVLPHAEVTIHADDGKVLSVNQIGIIKIKADSLSLGYYPNLTNKQVFQPDDLGFLDDRGDLNIIGRSSNKIITGGENVFPIEVEAAIRATKLVADVCVIGLRDRHWGQVVTAIYVPSYPKASTETLQKAIEDKLSKFKHPKYWVSLASLPRNSQGKVNYEQLQQIALDKIVIDNLSSLSSGTSSGLSRLK